MLNRFVYVWFTCVDYQKLISSFLYLKTTNKQTRSVVEYLLNKYIWNLSNSYLRVLTMYWYCPKTTKLHMKMFCNNGPHNNQEGKKSIMVIWKWIILRRWYITEMPNMTPWFFKPIWFIWRNRENETLTKINDN